MLPSARLLSAGLLSKAGFAHAFPLRGVDDAELRARLGVETIVQVKQVHGARVVPAHLARGAEADGIVARRLTAPNEAGAPAPASTAVGVRVADCAPVLLASVHGGDVAAVHAGWRGVVAHVLRGAVELLGAGPLVAAIGPCIGACCFEVGSDVAEQIAGACGDPRVVVRTAGEKAHVDLRMAVRAQLRALGVDEARIEDVPGCTKDDAHFHSYRRDGSGSGRMLAAIATRR